MVKLIFTNKELGLLKKSLDHSIRTGQFEYTRHETEATRKLLKKITEQAQVDNLLKKDGKI